MNTGASIITYESYETSLTNTIGTSTTKHPTTIPFLLNILLDYFTHKKVPATSGLIGHPHILVIAERFCEMKIMYTVQCPI